MEHQKTAKRCSCEYRAVIKFFDALNTVGGVEEQVARIGEIGAGKDSFPYIKLFQSIICTSPTVVVGIK
jgi:hypothetical protein